MDMDDLLLEIPEQAEGDEPAESPGNSSRIVELSNAQSSLVEADNKPEMI
jgi:hypothetical protein